MQSWPICIGVAFFSLFISIFLPIGIERLSGFSALAHMSNDMVPEAEVGRDVPPTFPASTLS